MNLIIKQYLSSLKERDELDAILPDLLSQMGLNVFSRPKKGTRQDGVDVAAVGKIGEGTEKVYLFSIKAGDLTRVLWDGDSIQSLRPSLNEIIDSYIPNRLPNEHKNKDIVICICLGGDIQEQVRLDVEGYIKQNENERISFEEWNGDKLASLIQTNFLREELLPENTRNELRKSLALLDEPESSFQHFSNLIKSIASAKSRKADARLMAMRQFYICLWILYGWCREAGNLESSYLSSEFVLLNSWEIAKPYFMKRTKPAEAIQLIFQSILTIYYQISTQYSLKILPHTLSRHTLSVATMASGSLDVNLKLFDLLGRLSLAGIWANWAAAGISESDPDDGAASRQMAKGFSHAVKELIRNNPVMLLPIKDDQAIDISMAVLLLLNDEENYDEINGWITEITARAILAHKIHAQYPCNLQNYSELLDHPIKNNEDYRQRVTSGSILFPLIALWAAILGNEDLYHQIQVVKEELLKHCTFQFWYPDINSEGCLYTNSDDHGATLSNPCIDRSSKEYLEQVLGECDHTPQYQTLSAVKNRLWPMILVACRLYRLPIPVELWRAFYNLNSK
jgi:hypothetical protein